jgi:hypothetical protein
VPCLTGSPECSCDTAAVQSINREEHVPTTGNRLLVGSGGAIMRTAGTPVV